MSVLPFTQITGSAAPLMRENVDTDVIIRIERLAALSRDALGPYALEALRYRADGSEEPDFVLNQPAFRGAPILLAGANFGCGSSREAAVWALMEAGIRCVIAPSFGDIFFNNCFQNGLLPIRLPFEQVQGLARASASGALLTVDLGRCTITIAGQDALIHFSVDPHRRDGLLLGLDDIEITLRDKEIISDWQRADRLRRPWAWASRRDPSPKQG